MGDKPKASLRRLSPQGRDTTAAQMQSKASEDITGGRGVGRRDKLGEQEASDKGKVTGHRDTAVALPSLPSALPRVLSAPTQRVLIWEMGSAASRGWGL